MKPLRINSRPLGLTMILVCGAWGCAHAQYPDGPATWRISSAAASWRQALGSGAPVGVLGVGGDGLNLIGAIPGSRDAGAAHGARTVGSALKTVIFPAGCSEQACGVYQRIVMLPAVTLAIPATLAGGGVGVLSTPSAPTVAAAEATLTRAWEACQPSATLQRHLMAAAQEGPGPRLVPVPGSTPAPAGDASAPVGDPPENMEAILTVFGPKAYLSSTEGVEQPNPRLALVLTVRIQVVRRTDGTVLYEARVTKESAAAYPFTAWAANDTQPLREEVDRVSASLAREIVEHLFGTETF